MGGYSQYHVCDERFVIVVPKGYPLSHVGPVMCAGITMYDPLIRHLRANKGKRIAIAGLGGMFEWFTLNLSISTCSCTQFKKIKMCLQA